ncbi:MAG: hypothetical protein K0S29_258 [Gammaproteobacteria bacterium]|nr:hypothetical protein [Gammaproteobacteria bacterium]
MSACLYAREKGINLYIWRPGKEPGQLVLQQQQLSVAASKTLHMFHKPELNHFDSLGPMPEQAESKELPVVPVRAALGALRQSLAKTVISESDSGLEVTLRL